MNKKQRERLKQQDPISLEITGIGHDGRGIAHHNGKVIFVDGALQGETVTAKVSVVKSKYEEADTVSVLKAALERVQP
ncbi:MAG: TRAM domain-containing protein, partial [Pseudomonadales bacterium]|nr:TRAM domain-containing protein [Pseudomonadales bacterium]